MKKTIIKAFIVLACMTLGIANVANSQIYSNEVCYYVEAGTNNHHRVAIFDGNKVYLQVFGINIIRKNLAEDRYYYKQKNIRQKFTEYEYVPSMSTPARDVYKRFSKNSYYSLNEFIAFTKDKSSYITWYYLDNKEDDGEKNRTTYIRIPEEELLPKAINDDFLNE